jgi:CheY-like chemotaxis protein
MENKEKNVNILLIENNKTDAGIIREAFNGSVEGSFTVLEDSVKAIGYLSALRKEENDHVRPDVILLDLNLPGEKGLEVLDEIKSSSDLRTIPVVVLTNSTAEEHIYKSYDLNANCYIIKPAGQEQFADVIKLIGKFWFGIAKLPSAN